ncbi:MAG: lipopolysaccharide transport periplasmic protein LptA [Deltaproteobacteria bacterium]|nr:lipopolysaccharide transport periplasmic protein LptA [Deltaproteobacteria bacterium]
MNRPVQLLLLGLLLYASAAVAQSAALPQPAALPIEVTAQQLEADQQQRQAIFSGKVVAKQGDITLYCDRLVVYSLPKQDQVDRLEASGNVRVIQLDRTATADRAVYRQRQGTLVLYGHAKVHQGQNLVSGDEITVYLRENRSVVKSGDGRRVKAVLFPAKPQGQEPK